MSDIVGLSAAATEWLVSGEQGLSSKAMFHRLVLGRRVRPFDYPHDPDDFRRCELLLREVPGLRERLPAMASAHPYWAALVRSWDRIVKTMEDESPGVFERPPRTWSTGIAQDLMTGLYLASRQ